MDLTRAALQKYRSKPDQQILIYRQVIFLKRVGLSGDRMAAAAAA